MRCNKGIGDCFRNGWRISCWHDDKLIVIGIWYTFMSFCLAISQLWLLRHKLLWRHLRELFSLRNEIEELEYIIAIEGNNCGVEWKPLMVKPKFDYHYYVNIYS